MAVTETMGPIYDRSHEHLGTTDALIIRAPPQDQRGEGARRERHRAARRRQPGVYRQRSGEMILPRNKDFYEAYKEKREAFNAAPVKAFATVS